MFKNSTPGRCGVKGTAWTPVKHEFTMSMPARTFKTASASVAGARQQRSSGLISGSL
jgi:hypothetical protein